MQVYLKFISTLCLVPRLFSVVLPLIASKTEKPWISVPFMSKLEQISGNQAQESRNSSQILLKSELTSFYEYFR